MFDFTGSQLENNLAQNELYLESHPSNLVGIQMRLQTSDFGADAKMN